MDKNRVRFVREDTPRADDDERSERGRTYGKKVRFWRRQASPPPRRHIRPLVLLAPAGCTWDRCRAMPDRDWSLHPFEPLDGYANLALLLSSGREGKFGAERAPLVVDGRRFDVLPAGGHTFAGTELMDVGSPPLTPPAAGALEGGKMRIAVGDAYDRPGIAAVAFMTKPAIRGLSAKLVALSRARGAIRLAGQNSAPDPTETGSRYPGSPR